MERVSRAGKEFQLEILNKVEKILSAKADEKELNGGTFTVERKGFFSVTTLVYGWSTRRFQKTEDKIFDTRVMEEAGFNKTPFDDVKKKLADVGVEINYCGNIFYVKVSDVIH